MAESKWCDKHNIEMEKEYRDDGEIVFHCPQCEYDRHEAYLKKWKALDKKWWNLK
jgi:hypothetical protein